jgi:hypothetical protein
MNRYPVQTYVVEENKQIIKDAIYKELSRDGQVFILYNRVQSIEETRSRIQNLVPDARIAIAHGQMSKNELESVILDFTKPLRFIREIPSNSVFDSYKGLSRGHISSDPLWFYIINQEDGKVLSLAFLAESLGKTIEQIVYNLDFMSISGQLVETENYLEFHFYPIKRSREEMPNCDYLLNKLPRLAPYKY